MQNQLTGKKLEARKTMVIIEKEHFLSLVWRTCKYWWRDMDDNKKYLEEKNNLMPVHEDELTVATDSKSLLVWDITIKSLTKMKSLRKHKH